MNDKSIPAAQGCVYLAIVVSSASSMLQGFGNLPNTISCSQSWFCGGV